MPIESKLKFSAVRKRIDLRAECKGTGKKVPRQNWTEIRDVPYFCQIMLSLRSPFRRSNDRSLNLRITTFALHGQSLSVSSSYKYVFKLTEKVG